MMPNKTIDRSLIERIRFRVRETTPIESPVQGTGAGRSLALTRVDAKRMRQEHGAKSLEASAAG